MKTIELKPQEARAIFVGEVNEEYAKAIADLVGGSVNKISIDGDPNESGMYVYIEHDYMRSDRAFVGDYVVKREGRPPFVLDWSTFDDVYGG